MTDLVQPALQSPFFRLVETVEVDVGFEEELTTLRVELFQDVVRSDQFRARTYAWRRVQLRGEDEEAVGSVETVLVPWPIPGALVTEEPFVASSSEAALGQVLDDLTAFLSIRTMPSEDVLPPDS